MLILHSTYHRHPGGVHHAFLTYCDALADRGFECVAVLPTAPPPLHVLERHSIAVIAHPAIASRWGARNPFAAAALSSAVAGRRPVAVIMHNGRSLGLLRRACPGVPMLVASRARCGRRLDADDEVMHARAVTVATARFELRDHGVDVFGQILRLPRQHWVAVNQRQLRAFDGTRFQRRPLRVKGEIQLQIVR